MGSRHVVRALEDIVRFRCAALHRPGHEFGQVAERNLLSVNLDFFIASPYPQREVEAAHLFFAVPISRGEVSPL